MKEAAAPPTAGIRGSPHAPFGAATMRPADRPSIIICVETTRAVGKLAPEPGLVLDEVPVRRQIRETVVLRPRAAS